MVDAPTKRWIRNASDERAVANGCRFDESRAAHFLEFVTSQCHLYEGERAGELVTLMPWQEELFSRIFGWVRFSLDWGREVRRFTKASIWIPKKNGKSPSAAMVGLYLLVADGEPGQKVFSAARDGKQAGIVHGHARAMVEMSPYLSATCVINKTTGQIAHTPTRSIYAILAGDNIRGQEGLNGSIIIDETHVVDDRLAKTIEYMGASRSEPLQFEASTAGDDPNGYGKKQYDYGKAVERGDVHDDQFLHVCYEAPQDASDEDCGRPEIWQAANPSWGHTIHPEEFRASYERSTRSLSDFATWKKYRLNIWQTSSQPWLRMGDWQACAATSMTA